MKGKTDKPIACTMRIGEMGDEDGVSVEECAIRMAKTGADIIGMNSSSSLAFIKAYSA